MSAPPVRWSKVTSPDAQLTSSAPNVPRPLTSADAVETSTSAPGAGQFEPQRARRAMDRTWSSDSPSFSALGVAPEPLARSLDRPGHAPRKRADEPAVHGDAFARGGRLERRLERLGQPQRDAG